MSQYKAYRMYSLLRHSHRVVALVLLAALPLSCSGSVEEADVPLTSFSINLPKHLSTAEVLTETRRIDFGTDQGNENLLEGWSQVDSTTQAGSPGAISSEHGSALRLAVLYPRDLDLMARIGPADDGCPGRQELSLAFNGNLIPDLVLDRGFSEYRIEIPAVDVRRGHNTLMINSRCPGDKPHQPKRATRWEYLLIDSGEPLQAAQRQGSDLTLPFGTAVRFLVELPRNSTLTLGGLDTDDPSGRLAVSYRLLGESRLLIFKTFGIDDEDLRIEIPASQGTWAWLTLSASRDGGGEQPPGALLLKDPNLHALAETEASVFHSQQRWDSPSQPRPNVIVYLVDTVRADHLGCYGYPKAVSPSIDGFAADAVRFENAMAQSSWTRTAVASLFTGMAPPSHGVFNRKDGLTPDVVTLAEFLLAAGYDTASFVTSGHIGPRWGMSQGFETFELITKNEMGLRYALSNGVNPPVFEWLDRDREKPFFLYVHTLDPHAPYAPPEEAAREFASDINQPTLDSKTMATLQKMENRRAERLGNPTPVTLGTQVWMAGLKQGIISPTQEMTEDLASLYDAEIFHNDTHFGRFLDHLRTTGLYENSIIFFLSDHGEEFHDRRSWGHGRTLFQEQLHIPLIARFPDPSIPRGHVVNGLARQIDIGATIVDYLDLPAPLDWQGSSLLPLVLDLGNGGARRPGYAHLLLDGQSLESYVEGGWKLICSHKPGGECQLYDISSDPTERRNLAAQKPDLVAAMTDKMHLWRNEGGQFQSFHAEPDEKTRLQLEALGYVF